MFNVPSYDLLGHLISEAGVSTDPAKLQDIRDQPTPASKKDVRTFLGLTGYYRNFVKDYTRIALPLVEMTKDSAPVPFVWTPEAEDTFQQIIGAFLKSTFLAKYDPNKVTHLITDASTEAYGGHIEQEGRPLCFFSGKFDSAQRNWATTLRLLSSAQDVPSPPPWQNDLVCGSSGAQSTPNHVSRLRPSCHVATNPQSVPLHDREEA